MTQNPHSISSPIKKLLTQRRIIDDDDDQHQDQSPQRETHNQSSFMKRFKSNQQTLRSKFKNYVDRQKCIFPHTYQKFRNSHYKQAQEEKNRRQVRRQKEEIIQEMNKSQNETSYYLNKNRQVQKVCSILANKLKKVQSIRKQRKYEVIRLQRSLNSIKQEIKQQKIALVRKVSNSKYSLIKNKQQLSQRKLSLAQNVKAERQIHRFKISQEKLENYMQKKIKCKAVRDSEQRVSFYVDRVKQEKKQMAQDLRLSKLFREIVQRQQVKIDSAKIKRKSKRQIQKFQNNTSTLQEKIKEFRKSLGERRLGPIGKVNLDKYKKNLSFSEPNDYTSNSQFFDVSHRSVTEQTFQ